MCNYHVEGPLHFGGSTRSRLFIYYRYLLARCHDCRHIVSVLVPVPEYDLPHILESAAEDIATLEHRVARGDTRARALLPLHRNALRESNAEGRDMTVQVEVCTVCGSRNLTIFSLLGGDEGERFDESVAWLDCPRCEEGKLLLETVGSWDELDDAP